MRANDELTDYDKIRANDEVEARMVVKFILREDYNEGRVTAGEFEIISRWLKTKTPWLEAWLKERGRDPCPPLSPARPEGQHRAAA